MRKLFTVLMLLGAAAAWSSAAPVPDERRVDPGDNYPPTTHSSSELDRRYGKHAKEQRKLYERDRKAAEKMAKKSISEREKYFRKHGTHRTPNNPPQ